MPEIIQHSAEVPSELGGQRLDQIAAQLFDEYSRSRLSSWIKDGHLTVDGAVLRPRDIVHGGAILALSAEQEAQGEWIAQDIALNIVYEDEQILVIDKPAGLVVHPAAGHADGTLLNALLHHVPDIINVPRAGIVHRLDKDTTGLMVVAKTIETMLALIEGWVDTVTADACAMLPHLDMLREAVRRKRAVGGPAEKTFGTLIGLELRPKRLREAAAMWLALTTEVGAELRDSIWSHPDLMPSGKDIDNPAALAERITNGGSDLDRELRDLLGD